MAEEEPDLREILQLIRNEPDEAIALLVLEVVVGIYSASHGDLVQIKQQIQALRKQYGTRH